MGDPRSFKWLAGSLLLGALSLTSPAAAELSLDQFVDWQNPLRASIDEFAKKLPRPVAEYSHKRAADGRDLVTFKSSEDAEVASLFGGRIKVSSFRVWVKDGQVDWIGIGLSSSKESAVEALQRLYQRPPARNQGQMGGGGASYEVDRWEFPDFSVGVGQTGSYVQISIAHRTAPDAEATSAATVQPELRADLDLLLSAGFWNCDVNAFEEHYVPKTDAEQGKPPQFEWLSSAKDRARFSRQMFGNVETKLTMFGGSVRVEEAVVEFVSGRAARVTVSFYNRGDSGEIDTSTFEKIYKRVGQSLGQVFKVAPRSQLISSNSAVKTVGWTWKTPQAVALLEYNDLSRNSRPEFLRLKMAAANQADWTMGRLSVGVQRMTLTKNITKAANGDLYIAGVPMVDQGAKGYCVAASCQRLFEYMQIPCDQHEMAQLLNVDAEDGADAFEMQKSLAKVDSKFNVSFKPLVNPELYYSTSGKRRVSLREFVGIVKDYTEKGMPLLWALQLGLHKEEPPLPGGGQVSGGHMRMIIGYNAAENKVLFTDSWGAGHELKRMDATDAYSATMGLYSMSPRGL